VDEFLGQRLMGQFDIVARCGQGAMGTVYRAHQVNMDRMVAIKILRRDLVRDRTVVKRLYREAKAAARLSHPNIITVHLVAETDDGVPYIVMEYLEGVDLDTTLKKDAPLALPRALRIADQIAAALSEAHLHDVVHRDLKPANIIVLEKQRTPDVIKVLDFGIAKILEGGQSEESRITKSGAIFGTPFYLSPEQATGSEIDARADLYSLGVILYRMVTGRLPFEAGSGLEVLVRHVKQPPPPPRLYNPAIPAALEEVVLHALEKDRERRFATGEELRAALARVAAGELHAVSAAAAVPQGPWSAGASGSAETDVARIKRTVAGFGHAGDPQPRAVSVPVLTPVAGPAPASGPAPAPAGASGWEAPGEDEEATDDLPGSVRYRAAAAPAPVAALPRLSSEPLSFGRPPAEPAAAPVVRSAPAASVPAAAAPAAGDSPSASIVTGQHAAAPGASASGWPGGRDRGRIFTAFAIGMAVVALGVGGLFVARDLGLLGRGGSAAGRDVPPAPDAGAAVPVPGPAVDAAAPPVDEPVRIGADGARIDRQGLTVRLSFSAPPQAGRENLLVVDLARTAASLPVGGATLALSVTGAGEPTRQVEALPAAVAGRYGLRVRFDRPGAKRLELAISTSEGTRVQATFLAEVAPRGADTDPGMAAPPPDRRREPGHRPRPRDREGMRLPPMDPRPPVDPPTPPADPPDPD
jgi:serine/threonine-protein kinase